MEVPDTVKSPYIGSSVGFHFYEGTDTKNTAVSQVENDFRRYTASANIRYKTDLDFQFVYQMGTDDNYSFATTSPVEADFDGFTATGAYSSGNWYYVLQYDELNADQVATGITEVSKVSPSIWYFLRDNFKAGLTFRFDVRGNTPEKHEGAIEIRAMF